MKISFFGSYDPNYSRNRIIKKGLITNKLKVFDNGASGLIPFRYFKLLILFLKHLKQTNAIIVGFPGHYDVPLAYILGKLFSKKVFYDIFASTYETYILDRKVVSKKSLKSKFYYFIDWLGLKLADYVIVDTIAHSKFYTQLYGFKPKKQIVVYVGSDTDYFYPRKVKEETDVLFYGSYQPLQGVDVIIKTAGNLPKVKFKLIGEGQTRKAAEELSRKLNLKNVEFINWLPLEKLAEEIAKAKIILGIFGTTKKATVVVPNKVYDSLSCRKAVITADTSAVREILADGINAVLVRPDNPSILADSIKKLLKDTTMRNRLAKNAYILSRKKLTPRQIVKDLLVLIDEK